MKLTTLKPRVHRLAQRVAPPARTERMRGQRAMDRAARIKARDLYTCQQCGTISTQLEVDHKVPLWQGGSDAESNLWSLCRECHAAKTAQEAALRLSQAHPGR